MTEISSENVTMTVRNALSALQPGAYRESREPCQGKRIGGQVKIEIRQTVKSKG
jgi:hypothetical protein